jgi:hypothetical protein
MTKRQVTFRVRVVTFVEIDGIPPTNEETQRASLPVLPSEPTRIISKYNDAVTIDCAARAASYPRVMSTGGGRHRELRHRDDADRARAVLIALGAVEVGDPEEAP